MFFTDSIQYATVMEAYYGKPKEFLIIEKELDKIINMVRDSENTKSISNSDSVKIIEKTFKKYFKLDDFILSFYIPYNINTMYNAYTYPKGFNYFRNKVSKNRVDSTGLVIGVNVDMGLIKFSNINSEELMAIILHEIGHNMSASGFSLLHQIQLAYFIDIMSGDVVGISIPVSIFASLYRMTFSEILGAPESEFNKIITKLIEKSPFFKKLILAIEEILLSVSSLVPGSKSLKKFADPINLINPISPRNIFGYAEEKYADSFATSYGYGPALSTGLTKIKDMDNVLAKKIITNTPLVNWFYDFSSVSTQCIMGILDEHPQEPSRIMAQLKKLERELKDPNVDPRVKKDIQNDIKRLKDFIENDYITLSTDKNKKRIFTVLYRYISVKLFEGTLDLREILTLFDVEE